MSEKNESKPKVSYLEGARNLSQIKCSCGAVWKRSENKKINKTTRQYFIAKHASHDLVSFSVSSTVF